MFELRWLEKTTNTCGVDGCKEPSCLGKVKTLQFRQWVLGCNMYDPVWTNWKDVPTEEE